VPESNVGLKVVELTDRLVSWLSVAAWAAGAVRVIPDIKSNGSVSEKAKDFLIKNRFIRLLHTVSGIRVDTNLGQSSLVDLLVPPHFCGYPKD
jgi:hypothetical protein